MVRSRTIPATLASARTILAIERGRMLAVVIPLVAVVVFFLVPVALKFTGRWRARREWVPIGALPTLLGVEADQVEATIIATGIKVRMRAAHGARFMRRDSLDLVLDWYAARRVTPTQSFGGVLKDLIPGAVSAAAILALEKVGDRASAPSTANKVAEPAPGPPAPARPAWPEPRPSRARRNLLWRLGRSAIEVPLQHPYYAGHVIGKLRPERVYVSDADFQRLRDQGLPNEGMTALEAYDFSYAAGGASLRKAERFFELVVRRDHLGERRYEDQSLIEVFDEVFERDPARAFDLVAANRAVGPKGVPQPPRPIADAIEYALARGWTCIARPGSGSTWGRLQCPGQDLDGCRIVIWSHASNSNAYARRITAQVDQCNHRPIAVLT